MKKISNHKKELIQELKKEIDFIYSTPLKFNNYKYVLKSVNGIIDYMTTGDCE